VTGRWFSPGTPVSSINKTDCHDITEKWLKVELNTITLHWNKTISWKIFPTRTKSQYSKPLYGFRKQNKWRSCSLDEHSYIFVIFGLSKENYQSNRKNRTHIYCNLERRKSQVKQRHFKRIIDQKRYTHRGSTTNTRAMIYASEL
jgi:hypothetical protein